MAHRLPNHGGLCRNIHGHRYKVCLAFIGEDTLLLVGNKSKQGEVDEGMVIDFHEVKAIAKKFFDDKLDHACMLSNQYDKDIIQFLNAKNFKVCNINFIPTAENMAQWIYYELDDLFKEIGVKLYKVTVWETPTAFAEYKPRLR
jgi:6-pyruvoyltetrahydropterin/6-carboxytetrahydropterin synthase